MKKKILGIIPARSGSKRLPQKNIKEFLGKPLLEWSVLAGKESGVFDRLILSTDSEEIAAIGKNAGVEVPFIRPAELATDTTSSYDVVQHVVTWMEKNEGFVPDWIILLEPPAPGRQDFHIREVVELIEKDVADSIVGISETPKHFSPSKGLVMNEAGLVTRYGDNALLRELVHRNQDVPTTFHINSAIYAFKYSNLSDGHNSLWGNSTHGYLMDNKYSFDIDTEEDWLIAEMKMKRLLEER